VSQHAWELEEKWVQLEDFPDYESSASGIIRSIKTGRHLRYSPNGNGVLKVNLMREGEVYTRSVAKIILLNHNEDYTEPPPGAVVSYVNGRFSDVYVENLEWRPRWYVQERAAQRRRTRPMRSGKILVVETGIIYDNSLDCANAIEGIEKYIVLCANSLRYQQYMGYHYRWMPN
jgi:hypothetical protein